LLRGDRNATALTIVCRRSRNGSMRRAMASGAIFTRGVRNGKTALPFSRKQRRLRLVRERVERTSGVSSISLEMFGNGLRRKSQSIQGIGPNFGLTCRIGSRSAVVVTSAIPARRTLPQLPVCASLFPLQQRRRFWASGWCAAPPDVDHRTQKTQRKVSLVVSQFEIC